MSDAVTFRGLLDPVYTEIEISCLPVFLASMRDHEIEALVVLGPDIDSSENHGRALRTMYPWDLHRAAKAMAFCDDLPFSDAQNSPLPSWADLRSAAFDRTKWAPVLKRHGYRTMLVVQIPIVLDRCFDCYLFSKRESHSSDSAASVTYRTLAAWKHIKGEIVIKQQILTHQEQVFLRLAAMGDTSHQSAQKCGTSERMVNFHIGNSLRKLNAPNKTSAVLKAIMMGIL